MLKQFKQVQQMMKSLTGGVGQAHEAAAAAGHGPAQLQG